MQPPPQLPSENSNSCETSLSPLVRAYRVWQGRNKFLCGGRLIFGPIVRYIFVSIFAIVAPVLVFCAFVATKLLHDFPHHLGWSIMAAIIALTLFALMNLVMTSGRDPGIVPRNAYPPETDDLQVVYNSDSEQSPVYRLSATREVIVNGITVKVKYCATCTLYRPPRVSHCSRCNNCVDRFDHHCTWVGQCIGLRNYRFYYMFVLSATLICLYVHAFCWVYIMKIKNSEEIPIWKAMTKTPASIALIIYTSLFVWFVGALTVFHTYLICRNRSTWENSKYRDDPQLENPFDRGIINNIKEIFCTRIPPSKINFRAKVPRTPGNVLLVNNESNEEENDHRDGFDNEVLSKQSSVGRHSVMDAIQEESMNQTKNYNGLDNEARSEVSSLGRHTLREITEEEEEPNEPKKENDDKKGLSKKVQFVDTLGVKYAHKCQ